MRIGSGCRDRSRLAQRIVERVEPALVRDPLTVQEAADEHDGLVEAVEALAEPGPEIEAEGVMFPLEPAAADAQDGAPARYVVKGRRELRGEARIAEGVGGHHRAQVHPGRERRERRQRCPALELGARPVALVGQQVVVQPDGIETGRFSRQTRVAQCRPVGALDPVGRSESHAAIVRPCPGPP